MEEYPKQFRKLVSLVSGRKGQRLHPASLIVTITPDNGGNHRPLFFCANGQGEAEALAHVLGPDQPLYFLESGFYAISRTNGVIRSLAKHHLPDILKLYPTGPYDILGYSFGCSTTLVLAELLSQENREISFVGLLDARIGPNPAYRWYFKNLDQTIAKHLETERERFSEAWKTNGVKGAITQTGRSIGSALRINGKPTASDKIADARRNVDIIPADEPPYQPPEHKGTIHLFRASDHWFRNLLFPRAGFPKANYPDLKITKIQGSHHTVMTKEAFRTQVCNAMLKTLRDHRR